MTETALLEVLAELEVTATIDRAMSHYDVQILAADPPGWHREIDEWSDRYAKTVTVMFPTNRRTLMANACSKFYTAVVNQTLTHDGNPVLARHLANAMVKETPDGAYITKERRDSPRKIDAAVAAVVAFDRAGSHVPKRNARVVSFSPW